MSSFYQQKKSGFVILYAVIVSSVVLVVSLVLSNIITQELVISSISKNARNAYNAAISGFDCANFWKLGVYGAVFGHLSADQSTVEAGSPPVSEEDGHSLMNTEPNMVYCAGTANPVIFDRTDPQLRQSHFYFDLPNHTNPTLCARVDVQVDSTHPNNPTFNFVHSVGYNVPCATVKPYVDSNRQLPPRVVQEVVSDQTETESAF